MEDLNKLLDEISREITLDVLNAANKYSKFYGDEFANQLMTEFLARFVGAVVFKTLTDRPKKKMGHNDLEEFCLNKFNDIKIRIQDANASAFQGAMNTYTGNKMEYYCTIKLLPPVANKEPC